MFTSGAAIQAVGQVQTITDQGGGSFQVTLVEALPVTPASGIRAVFV